MGRLLDWVLAHGYSMAGVTAAWIGVVALGGVVVLGLVNFLPGAVTEALEQHLERRNQRLAQRLKEARHLMSEEELRHTFHLQQEELRARMARSLSAGEPPGGGPP